MKPCVECGDDEQRRAARGLCKPCYDFHSRAGTIDKFELSRPSSADVKYRQWLFSDPKVPASVVTPWVREIHERHGTFEGAALGSGVNVETLRRLAKGVYKHIRYSTAEDIAVEAGRMVELAMAMPEVGVEGWSEWGRYCGDGSELHHGCGSFHHPHSMKGLCAECFAIAIGLSDMETRDVRFAQEVTG